MSKIAWSTYNYKYMYIREYGSTLYEIMGQKKMAGHIASDVLTSLLICADQSWYTHTFWYQVFLQPAIRSRWLVGIVKVENQ